jgi:hypothetical protein
MILSILSYFEYDDDRLDSIADHLLEQQMPDGGWNCRHVDDATHASVHTTISAFESLRNYQLHRGRKVGEVRAAQRRGREFLLVHRLFRSHRTGEIINPVFTCFAFPPRWHYDVLRALGYFQAVDAPRRGSRPRPQQPAQGWPLQHSYKGKTYFELERLGAPSRWNTLRALQVLKWWYQGVRDPRSPKQVEGDDADAAFRARSLSPSPKGRKLKSGAGGVFTHSAHPADPRTKAAAGG